MPPRRPSSPARVPSHGESIINAPQAIDDPEQKRGKDNPREENDDVISSRSSTALVWRVLAIGTPDFTLSSSCGESEDNTSPREIQQTSEPAGIDKGLDLSENLDAMNAPESTNVDGGDDFLGKLFIPTEHFSTNYYYGLPSSPPLLATTKPRPSIVSVTDRGYPMHRIILPISGRHPIVNRWEPVISSAIMGVLTQMDIDWTSLEVVHIPDADDPSTVPSPGPAIVWIGVAPDTLDFEKAAITALKCQDVIDKNNIADCFVEMRSSVVRRSGSDGGVRFMEMFQEADDLKDEKLPFTAALGFPICARKTLHAVGSGGFFFTAGGADKNIYLVTARHVVLDESFEESKVEYIRKNASQPKWEVVRFGNDAHFQEIVGGMASSIEILDERLGIIDRAIANGTATPANVTARQSILNAVAAYKELQKHTSSQFGTVDSRVLGELVWAPPITFTTQPGRTTLDLAVIKLGPGKLDERNFLGNVIYLSESLNRQEIMKVVYMDPASATSFKIPADRIVRLHGQTPEAEVNDPSMKDFDGEECTVVFKCGQKSGATFGKASRLSFFSREMWEGVSMLSREWGVVGTFPQHDRGAVFSKPGDSGACVADAHGRVSGILLGGTGFREGMTDITYVTPIHFIMKELRSTKMFQDASLL